MIEGLFHTAIAFTEYTEQLKTTTRSLRYRHMASRCRGFPTSRQLTFKKPGPGFNEEHPCRQSKTPRATIDERALGSDCDPFPNCPISSIMLP